MESKLGITIALVTHVQVGFATCPLGCDTSFDDIAGVELRKGVSTDTAVSRYLVL